MAEVRTMKTPFGTRYLVKGDDGKWRISKTKPKRDAIVDHRAGAKGKPSYQVPSGDDDGGDDDGETAGAYMGDDGIIDNLIHATEDVVSPASAAVRRAVSDPSTLTRTTAIPPWVWLVGVALLLKKRR